MPASGRAAVPPGPRVGFTAFPASPARRLAGAFVDLFLVVWLTAGVTLASLGWGGLAQPSRLGAIGLGVAGVLLVCRDCAGRSVGKRLMRLAVRDAANPDSSPTWSRLLVRNLTAVVWPVEVLALLANPRGRRLGDHLAATTVVQAASARPGPARVIALVGMLLVLGASMVFALVVGVVRHSAPYQVALDSISRDAGVARLTGGTTGYGWLPQGEFQVVDGRGEARFEITVLGAVRSGTVVVTVHKEAQGAWRVQSLDVHETH